MSRNINPIISVLVSRSELLLATEKIATPFIFNKRKKMVALMSDLILPSKEKLCHLYNTEQGHVRTSGNEKCFDILSDRVIGAFQKLPHHHHWYNF